MCQDVEISMVDHDLEPALFDEVIEAIRSTLTVDQQSSFCQYADADGLLEDLEAFCDRNETESRRLHISLKRVTLFACTFAPFFDLLGVFVDVKGEWIGYFWGSVRLIFEAGSKYIIVFEKVADVFKSIAHLLPNYQQLRTELNRQLHCGHDERMVTLLSYVYADIAQCCLDIYSMLSRDASRVSLRHLRLSSSPPTPTLFWRPLDSRLAQLEARLVHHNKWVHADVSCQPGDHGTKALHRREYIEFLDQQQLEAEKSSELLVEQRMARRMRRIDKIKAWLSDNCEYRDVYVHRTRQRHPNTCNWFLSSAAYCHWKNVSFDQASANNTSELERNWHDRLLFVQAKPGFGKSFISSAIVDDLSTEAEDLDIDEEHEPPSTAFFNFSAAHSYCTLPSDAFRALANQLIHTHRHDRQTLDAVSILMRKMPSHAQASSDDILILLSLLLRQHPTFLIIDGIDECADVDLFLCSLLENCKISDTRIILFSRPNLKIPLDYQRWAPDSPHIVHLAEDSNSEDIQAYVLERLNGLADRGFFGINMDRSLIMNVAKRSNGVFLWASLVVKYMQSPALSPDERHNALQQIERLEGLDSLYRNILEVINLRPNHEKHVAVGLLRWLSLSINRLCVPGLHIATTPSQMTGNLTDFMGAIPKLTCGLVEVTECNIVFTHPSIKEYLQSPELRDSPFSLYDEVGAHKELAARCLSFLAYDVPKRPLGRLQPHSGPRPSGLARSSRMSMRTDNGYKSMPSAFGFGSHLAPTLAPSSTGSSQCVPEQFTRSFEADVPFLRYSCLCWPIHLTRALSSQSLHLTTHTSPEVSSADHNPFKALPWLPPLSAFLTDRSAVTTWVEASWRFNLPPNLSRLVPLLDALRQHVPPATVEGRELRWVVRGLRELCEALTELKEEHGTTLRENPSLIWQWRGTGSSRRGDGVLGGGRQEGSYWPLWDERMDRVAGML